MTLALAGRTFAHDGADIGEARMIANLIDPGGTRNYGGATSFTLERLVSGGMIDTSALPDDELKAAGRGADGPASPRSPATTSSSMTDP